MSAVLQPCLYCIASILHARTSCWLHLPLKIVGWADFHSLEWHPNPLGWLILACGFSLKCIGSVVTNYSIGVYTDEGSVFVLSGTSKIVSSVEVVASIFSGSGLKCAKAPDLRFRNIKLMLVSFDEIYSWPLKVGLFASLFKRLPFSAYAYLVLLFCTCLLRPCVPLRLWQVKLPVKLPDFLFPVVILRMYQFNNRLSPKAAPESYIEWQNCIFVFLLLSSQRITFSSTSVKSVWALCWLRHYLKVEFPVSFCQAYLHGLSEEASAFFPCWRAV